MSASNASTVDFDQKESMVVVGPLSAATVRISRAGPPGKDLPFADLTGCFVESDRNAVTDRTRPHSGVLSGGLVVTTTISRRPNVPGPSIDPRTEPYVIRRVQVHQHNDSGLLEFFNTHGVEYDLTGDHLFIIRSREMDLAAGPGDWLVVGPDGEVDVDRGDYALRAQRAMTRARNARRERSNVVQATN